jgi:hypothetical protein
MRASVFLIRLLQTMQGQSWQIKSAFVRSVSALHVCCRKRSAIRYVVVCDDNYAVRLPVA